MNNQLNALMQYIKESPTAYHASATVARVLDAAGFVRLDEGAVWWLSAGGRYYTVRDGSALIAFSLAGRSGGFRMVASHLDSPCFAVKGEAEMEAGGCTKLNVEPYGGPLYYSYLDIPLCLAGRVMLWDEKTGTLTPKNVEAPTRLVIPSLAIHFAREANRSLALNPQTDLCPLYAVGSERLPDFSEAGKRVIAADLFLVNASEPTLVGADNRLLLSPRIDNLTSVFASLTALLDAPCETGVSLAYFADHEEVGSRTRQGAGSNFLATVLARIAEAREEVLSRMLADSLLLSCDNAHAMHPNHQDKSDPTNKTLLGGGVVIKHHANRNYTTDAASASIFSAILDKSDIPYQHFYMRSDLPCGSTLGAISSSQVSVRSVDIGIAQLAMHAATETAAAEDYLTMIRALRAFYAATIKSEADGTIHLT